jgi:asparagine synthetase B (glutamine-hydrolysing)
MNAFTGVFIHLLQAQLSRLFIARDCLGRRSLLVHHPTADDTRFYIASVVSSSTYNEVEELSTSSIYCIDLGSWGGDNEVC